MVTDKASVLSNDASFRHEFHEIVCLVDSFRFSSLFYYFYVVDMNSLFRFLL